MKIAFNPSTVAALTAPPNNKDITFDLRGQNIFARGVKFYGTDTNTWRDIKINNVSIGSHILDLRNGSNTTLTNTNGVVTINSTWRPVVDNLTSDSTTSSLSANQGRVLAGLINGKSDSDHNHDDRYLKLIGGTLTGNLVGTSAMFSGRFYGNGDDEGIIIKPSPNGYAGLILGTHDGERSVFYYKPGAVFWRYGDSSGTADIYHPKKSGIIALTSDIPSKDSWNYDDRYIKKVGGMPTNAYDLIITPEYLAPETVGDSGGGIHVKAHTGTSFQLWLHDTSNVWYKKTGNGNWTKMDAGYADVAGSVTWDNVTNKPATATRWPSWDEIANKPNTFTPSDHNHDGRYVYNYGGTQMDGVSVDKNALGMSTNSGITGDWWHILQAAWNSEYRWNSQIAFPTQNRNGMYYRSGLDDNTKWGAWVKLLDTGNSSISGNTITINGSSLTVSKSDHNHDYLVVNEADEKSFNSAYHNFQVLYAGGGNGITGRPDNVDAFGLIRLRAAWGWSGQMLLANGGSLYIRSSADAQMTNTLAWRTILDSSNYSSILDSRYYTESEIDTKLAKKLDRVKLTTGSWNPRSYNLAADYYYNGGDLSISESGGQIHVSVDGYFWQNEGQYRVLDTSDVAGLKGDLTVHQYLSNTDTTWWPLIWGGSDHNNVSDSTGAVYKSHDVLSWQTSSQTLYATRLQTTFIDLENNRGISRVTSGGTSPFKGIKLPDLQSNGVGIFSKVGEGDGDEGGVIISADTSVIYNSFDTGWGLTIRDKDKGQMNISGDGTIAFGVRQDYRAYSLGGFEKAGSSNSYVLLGGGDHKLESALNVANADMVDGLHGTDGRTFNGNINWSSNWNDAWSDGTNKHPWYGFDHRYPNTGAYSTTITDYFGMTIKTANTLRLDCRDLLINGTNISNLNVASASKLRTARNIWGQSFDGTRDVDGTLRIRNTTSGYCEGIRIQTKDGAWSTIILGATSDSGTNANAWSIHRKDDNNFSISRNSADGLNGLVMTSIGMGLGTTAPTQRLDVVGNIRATGQIIRGGSSQAWVNGRNGALLRETSVAGYHTLWSLKTTDGSWDFGEYNAGRNWNNIPVLSYITDSNYNSGNNAPTYQIKFPLASGTVALTSDILNYYWANVKISTSSSTTTSPTVHTLTATRICAGHDPGIDNSISCSNWFRSSGNTGWYNTTYRGGWYMSDTSWIRTYNNVGIHTSQIYADSSIRMSSIRLERTNEINSSDNLLINYGSSTNVSLCNGGGNVGIGTVSPTQKLDVNGNIITKGFGIQPYYLSKSVLLPTISPGDGYKYKCLEIGRTTEISCIIADKAGLMNERGILIKFNKGYDGQIILLKDLQNYGSGNGYFWVMPSGCNIIKADGSSILVGQNQISNIYDDGHSRFLVYSSLHNVWIEFLCS